MKKLYIQINFFVFFLLLASISLAEENKLENKLVGHASPYLAMHGQDPVAWQDWNEDVLALAKKQGKLIFISSGYFACHWCHVMQRESYSNKEIADILNKNFIPVKVDRELLPALDKHLIDFVQRTQGSAGWPLNAFLTPEGYPLVGLTYSPPEKFEDLLTRLTALWKKDSEKSRDLARRALLRMAVEKEQAIDHEAALLSSEQLQERFVESIYQGADELSGGFGQQSRFPMAPQLMVMLAIQKKKPDDRLKSFLTLTLDQMADIGLRDHLAGGFFRYTVDPGWLEPHYEKMLYTQAQLVDVYLLAAKVLGRPDYNEVAVDTVNFVIRSMQGNQGAYVASFSAVDDKGREGGYYLWPDEELTQVLDEDVLTLARRHWLLEGVHDVDEGFLPKRGVSVEILAEENPRSVNEIQAALTYARNQLLIARSSRVLPVDVKELAGWNGLMLAAIANVSRTLNAPSYTNVALALKKNLFSRLWDGKQVFRAKKEGAAVGSASLNDYAYMAYGLHEWIKLAGTDADKKLFEDIIAVAWQRFYLKKGWQQTDKALLPGMSVDKATEDGALPSASALLIRLSMESSNADIKALALKARDESAIFIQDAPFWYASHAKLFF